jgi:hypothetical protein
MNPATGDPWSALSGATSAIPEAQMLGQSNGEYDWTAFDAIKAANFAAVRGQVFHYALSGHEYASNPPGSSGISRNASDFGNGASDFLVTLGPACAGDGHCSGTVGQQAGTFMHELGHNLGLGHGGGDHLNRKPNYLSIMNYDFQFSGLVVNGSAGTYDYSRYGPESLATIQEASLDEATGLGVAGGPVTALTMLYRCPGGAARTWQLSVGPAIDWTCDGVIGSGPFAIDLNFDGGMTSVSAFEDWSHIVYGGGAVGDPGAGVTLPATTPTVDPSISVLLASAELLSTPSATAVTYTGSQSVQYSDVATLSARLAQPDLPPGAGVPGARLDFTLGTQSASTGPTDVGGNASTSLVVTQPPGSATSVGTSFGGGDGYAPSSLSASFSITKESCTLGYSGDVVSAPLALTTLAADLGETDASLGDRSGKAVMFTATGVVDPIPRTFAAITDASGRAVASAPLPADVYAVTASFGGDAFYAPCATPGETLVTVEAAAAKVTGGGWISIGTGRTSFGFNAIPQAGGSWKGQLQIRSHSGKNRFHARVVTILTASGASATWSGSGSWNGEPNFNYTVSVVDSGVSDAKKDAISIVIAKQGGGMFFTTGGLQSLKGGNLTVH